MGVRVLLIEDDQTIAEPLAEGLGHFGLAVHHVGTGNEGLRGPYGDVVLLDLGLPDMDGIDVCRGIRQTSDVPIIILSARGEEADRVLGLELGADDYLAKPFSIRELVARVRAVTRRTQRAGTGQTGPAGQTAQAGPAGQFAGADAYGPGTSGASSSRGAESWSRAGDSFGGDSFQGDSFGGESLRSDAYGGEPLRSESYGGDAYGGDSYGDESYGGESYGGESFSSYEPADTTRQFASSRSFEKGPEPRASRTARHARDANSSFGSTASYDRTRSFESPDPVFDPAPPPPEAAPEGPSGPLVVDRRTRQVWVGNAPVALTPKEFELLALLTEDPGAVYSRQQILDRVWDPHYEGPTKTLDVHVATLRRKLGNSAWIQTLRGVGFRLAVHTRPPAAYQAQAPGPQAAYR